MPELGWQHGGSCGWEEAEGAGRSRRLASPPPPSPPPCQMSPVQALTLVQPVQQRPASPSPRPAGAPSAGVRISAPFAGFCPRHQAAGRVRHETCIAPAHL